MLSDDELREVLIDEARSMAEEAGENPDDMTVDEAMLAQVMLAGRAVERAAYERAAALVVELTEDNATADAIRALGRQ